MLLAEFLSESNFYAVLTAVQGVGVPFWFPGVCCPYADVAGSVDYSSTLTPYDYMLSDLRKVCLGWMIEFIPGPCLAEIVGESVNQADPGRYCAAIPGYALSL
jgi:hypothetical protein